MSTTSIDQAIFKYLQGSRKIVALVGDRIFMDQVPPDTEFPYITRTKFANPHEMNLVSASGLSKPSFQIDVWADDDESREAVGQALLRRLNGLSSKRVGKAFISHCLISDENDSKESRQDASNTPIYRRRLDFNFGFTESIPDFR